jgi:heat-inducible transcriptional repressor
VLTPRQELLLERVVETHMRSGVPVGSKALAAEAEWGSSTIRNELAQLEEHGLLAHPHTSAGRVPTDAGYRYFVDRLLPRLREEPAGRQMPLQLVRREVDEAMRMTTETLSQVTNLLAVVTAPPIETATIRHIEVLVLQPQVLMVVVITSAGGVTRRVLPFDRPVDTGLADWAKAYLNEQLVGLGPGARILIKRLTDPELGETERVFLEQLAPAFTDLEGAAGQTLYADGAARLFAGSGTTGLPQLETLMDMLERRVTLLAMLRDVLAAPDVYVRIGSENATPALQGMSLVAQNYGLPARSLGTVSVIGPVRMDYGRAIRSVRAAAGELSRFVEDVYDES